MLAVQLAEPNPIGVNGDTLHIIVYGQSMSATRTAGIKLVSTLGDKTTVWYTPVLLDPEK